MVDDIMDNNKNKDKELFESVKPKENTKKFTTIETTLLVIISVIIGFSIGFVFNKNKIETTSAIKNDKYLNEFIKNYKFITNNYYETIDKQKLINDAIDGMMKSLGDPHSVYLDEEESNDFEITLNGSYKGLGIQIIKDEKTGYMQIVDVFKKSSAAESGLLPGDMIVSINNKLSIDMTASQFTSIVKESEEDLYRLKILREDKELNVNINKKIVTLNSVTSDIYNIENKKVGYIYIGIFANNTYLQFKNELEKLEKDDIDNLIIDVRGNTGGHLTSVDNILDLFLNDKQIMYKFEKNDKVNSIYATGKEKKSYGIILLGDGASASASEVLIAGLRENLNSKFIGEKTYGKGTVQELMTLPNGSQYKITVKKWLTPKGNWVNASKGIEPDIKVTLDSKYFETYEDEDDNQLQVALDYIKEK